MTQASRKRAEINSFFEQPDIINIMTEKPEGFVKTIITKLKEQTGHDISPSNVYQRSNSYGSKSKHDIINEFFAQEDIINIMTVKPKGYIKTLKDKLKEQTGFNISPSNIYQRITSHNKTSNGIEVIDINNIDLNSEDSNDSIVSNDSNDSNEDLDNKVDSNNSNDSQLEKPSEHTITISVTFDNHTYDNVSIETINKILQLLQN